LGSAMAIEPGFLFMANSKTFGECMSRSLLGESKDKFGLVQAAVKQDTPLLLLDFARRVLYGPFYAAQPPALNLEPCAWVRAARRMSGAGAEGGMGQWGCACAEPERAAWRRTRAQEGGATRAPRKGRSANGEGSGADGATSPYPAQVRICRRGRVRSWQLPQDLLLKAGRLGAQQTAELLQARARATLPVLRLASLPTTRGVPI
jgi:hypothetical protein